MMRPNRLGSRAAALGESLGAGAREVCFRGP